MCNAGYSGPDCASPVICVNGVEDLGNEREMTIEYSDEHNYGSVATFHCEGVPDSHGTQVCGADGQFTGDLPVPCNHFTSCKEIIHAIPDSTSGTFTIERPGGVEVDVYCDMETDGGGWTLTFLLDHIDSMSVNYFPHIREDTGAYPLDPTTTPGNWVIGPSLAERQQYWSDTEATEWRASNYDGADRVVDVKSSEGFVSGNSVLCAAAGYVSGACGRGYHNQVFAQGTALQDFCRGVCYNEGDAISLYQVGKYASSVAVFAN